MKMCDPPCSKLQLERRRLITFDTGRVLVQNDPKPPDDNGEVPKPNRVVGNSIPDRETVSLLDRKTNQVVKHLLCSFILVLHYG